MIRLTEGASLWRMVVLILILVVASALSASGHDILTALLLSTVVIGICVDVVGRMLPEHGEAA